MSISYHFYKVLVGNVFGNSSSASHLAWPSALPKRTPLVTVDNVSSTSVLARGSCFLFSCFFFLFFFPVTSSFPFPSPLGREPLQRRVLFTRFSDSREKQTLRSAIRYESAESDELTIYRTQDYKEKTKKAADACDRASVSSRYDSPDRVYTRIMIH